MTKRRGAVAATAVVASVVHGWNEFATYTFKERDL